MYSEEQYHKALEVYEETRSITKTITILGYPKRRQTLYNWINRKRMLPEDKSTFRGYNSKDHPRHPSLKLKLEALHRCFELGEDVQSVANEIGYSTASIYTWRKKYIRKGAAALMNRSDERPRGDLTEGAPASTKELEQLKEQIQDMQMEIDILKETINVLKKDPGIDQAALRNREKAVIIDALKDKYSLPILLKRLELSKSSYYYQKAAHKRDDKYKEIRSKIQALFHENSQRYGYRRIHGLLKRENITVSEKVIRQIIREDGLAVNLKRHRKYSSYQGEISPSVPNRIERNFHADRPNQKWLTDITEFALPEGKVYLSALVDCFDGMLPGWTIGTTPDSALVNTMLDQAISRLPEGERPLVHSDRGCHYRWSGWIERMEKAGLERSMSGKGCSPDNATCEGLFGRIKNEMFYYENWTGIHIPEFIDILNKYLIWYNTKRIKVSLGNRSPWEYRKSLGLAI